MYNNLTAKSQKCNATNLKLRALLPHLLFLLVTQQSSQNLSARALGHNVNKLDTACEPLVLALVILDMLLDLSLDDGV